MELVTCVKVIETVMGLRMSLIIAPMTLIHHSEPTHYKQMIKTMTGLEIPVIQILMEMVWITKKTFVLFAKRTKVFLVIQTISINI